jgi:membrane protein implicated in regulation of membrane protease activity
MADFKPLAVGNSVVRTALIATAAVIGFLLLLLLLVLLVARRMKRKREGSDGMREVQPPAEVRSAISSCTIVSDSAGISLDC